MSGPSFFQAGSTAPRRAARIEEGFVQRFDLQRGTCTVETTSGRTINNVRARVEIGNAAGGQRATPMTGARCLVAYFEPDSWRHAYLVGLYMESDTTDQTGDWGAPGDWTYRGQGGGQVRFSQSGTVEIEAEKWCKLALIAGRRETRLWTEHLDIQFSTLSSMRSIQDGASEASFFELFINSRYHHRAGDSTPDVGLTLGNQVRSDRVGPHNPQSPFLSHFWTEARNPNDGADPTHLYEWSTGNVGGVVERRHVLDVGDGYTVTEERGFFEDTTLRLIMAKADEERFRLEIKEDGRLQFANPEWSLDVSAETDGEVRLTNTKTAIVAYADKIDVGEGAGDLEPMAKGEQLQELLERLITAIGNIILPTPVGPTTGPPINMATEFNAIKADLYKLKSTVNRTA